MRVHFIASSTWMACILASCTLLAAAEPAANPDYGKELPRIPPLSPAEAPRVVSGAPRVSHRTGGG